MVCAREVWEPVTESTGALGVHFLKRCCKAEPVKETRTSLKINKASVPRKMCQWNQQIPMETAAACFCPMNVTSTVILCGQ